MTLTSEDTVATTSALGVSAGASGLSVQGIVGAPFGLEVRGLTWDNVNADVVRVVRTAVIAHSLVVFRGQSSPTDEQLDGFLRTLGRLVLDTEDGAVHYSGHRNLGTGPTSALAKEMVAYQHRAVDNSGSTYYDPQATGASELVWHNDQSHRPMLKVLSVLEALDFDDDAVPTQFRNTYVSAEMLSSAQRAELGHRQAIYFDPRLPSPAEMPRASDAMHPLLLAHPHTGRIALYVNEFADRIAGVDRQPSDALLAELRTHIANTAPEYVHRWQTGDLVIWDNIGLQHRRDPIPAGQRRHLRQHGGLAE
ncbi:MAG TPA: TauD/TfdA family dioxygenase [Ilumatobacteraceae bacterium]|nr:TauD/TfdA family dioxygenase [Ilumatobacteraceae bacterium]